MKRTKRDSNDLKIPKGDRFVFITERSIREDRIQLTRSQFAKLRSKLPRGIYWLQIADGGAILWNWILLNSYLIYGSDSRELNALVEEYLATLPTAS